MAAQELGSLTGTILATRYRLIGLVKAGGMGAVYEAEDTKLGRRVAVKILSPEFTQQPDMVRRFFREAKAPSFAQHPNIVEYLDFDQISGGVAYLVMEYLQGDDLERVLKRRGPLSWPELAPLMLQSCRALSAAHAAGIIHRDIKPSNFILLDRNFEEDPPIIKLIDFGIAKFTEESRLHSHTEVTQHLMGSQRFIAPEMYARVAANPRTDIYALGVTMFRLLTGKYPEASGGYDMIPPSVLRPDADIPPQADELVLRATHVNPYARFETMVELENAIADYLRRPETRIDLGPPPISPSGTTGPSPVLREPSSATVALRRPRVWPYVLLTATLTILSAGSIALLVTRSDDVVAQDPHAVAPASTPDPAPQPAPQPPAPTTPSAPIADEATPFDEIAAPNPAVPTAPAAPEQPEAPPLDMKLVDKQLARQAKAVTACGVEAGLFKGMKLRVSVSISPGGRTRAAVENAGNHDYVKCIRSKLERLDFGPNEAGGKTTHEYTI